MISQTTMVIGMYLKSKFMALLENFWGWDETSMFLFVSYLFVLFLFVCLFFDRNKIFIRDMKMTEVRSFWSDVLVCEQDIVEIGEKEMLSSFTSKCGTVDPARGTVFWFSVCSCVYVCVCVYTMRKNYILFQLEKNIWRVKTIILHESNAF